MLFAGMTAASPEEGAGPCEISGWLDPGNPLATVSTKDAWSEAGLV